MRAWREQSRPASEGLPLVTLSSDPVSAGNLAMGLTMSDYEAQATKFLADHNLAFRAAYQGDKCPMWCDGGCRHGDRYRVTLRRMGDARRSVSFDFWNSLNDMQSGKAPSAYDVLACISSDYYTPETLADFCSEYGYDEDSRKAEQTFKASDKHARKLRAFFSKAEAEALSEIR